MSLGLIRKVGLASLLAGALAPALATTALTPAAAEDGLVPSAQITLPTKITSFDISFVDPVVGVYILGDRTGNAVDVIDTSTNTLILQAGKGLFKGATGNNDTSGPDGVLIVNHREIWAGDGDSTMKVLSLSSGALLATISTGGAHRVDEMCHDPVHGIVLAANNAEDPFPFVTFFTVRGHKAVKKIVFDGTNNTPKATNGIEQCQWSPRTGLFYITVPEVNGPGQGPPNANQAPGGVAVLDPVSMTVLTTYTFPGTGSGQTASTAFDLNNCSGPQGMAVGPAPQILIGCNGGKFQAADRPTVIINETNGSLFARVPLQSGADMVDFSAANGGHYTLARSNNNPPYGAAPSSCAANNITAGPQVIGVIDANEGGAVDSDADVPAGLFSCSPFNGGATPARGGNHSIASDPTTGKWFFPVASTSGSTLCSSLGGSDSQGCIVVFTDPGAPSQQCVAPGVPVVDVTAGRGRVLMMAPCP
jgi:hypothetical protein